MLNKEKILNGFRRSTYFGVDYNFTRDFASVVSSWEWYQRENGGEDERNVTSLAHSSLTSGIIMILENKLNI